MTKVRAFAAEHEDLSSNLYRRLRHAVPVTTALEADMGTSQGPADQNVQLQVW